MVHPTPRNADKIEKFFPRWRAYFNKHSSDPKSVLCILSNSPPEMRKIAEMAKENFGDRLFMDPDDWSEKTKISYVDMVEKTFGALNLHEDSLYGLWTARNALRWAEGLKRDLARRGLTYSPPELCIFGFGSMWGGCMTKYVSLMSHQLGAEKTPDILPELCSDAGFPIQGEFLEKFELSDHVWVFLFQANNGTYFAHFMESLKPVFERFKTVTLTVEPNDCFVHVGSFNAYHTPDKSQTRSDEKSIVFPVMDGYSAPNVSVLCRHGDYDRFKQSVRNATVTRNTTRGLQMQRSSIPYQQPVPLNNFC